MEFLHSWEQYIPPNSLKKKKSYYPSLCKNAEGHHFSNIQSERLETREKPLLLLPSKLQHTACCIQPDTRRQRYITHKFKPADKKKDFFYVSNKRQSNVIFTCIQNNTGLEANVRYPNKK